MIDVKLDAKKSQELRTILFELAKSQELMENEQARAKIYIKLENLYYLPESNENYRHLYSDIFSTLSAILDDPTKGSVDILVQNLGLIRENYPSRETRNTYQGGNIIDVNDSIRKLYDHVSLDIARTMRSDFHKDISSLSEQIAKVKIEIEQAQRIQGELQKKTENFEKQLADAQNEYISILGIFSAVVLAFVGGSMFSSSVLESVNSTNVYRLILITDFLAFVIINLVYLLVSFIMKINGTSRTDSVECSAVVRWLLKKMNIQNTARHKLFFPIRVFYVICLIVASLDVIAWAIDLGSLVSYITKSLPWIR